MVAKNKARIETAEQKVEIDGLNYHDETVTEEHSVTTEIVSKLDSENTERTVIKTQNVVKYSPQTVTKDLFSSVGNPNGLKEKQLGALDEYVVAENSYVPSQDANGKYVRGELRGTVIYDGDSLQKAHYIQQKLYSQYSKTNATFYEENFKQGRADFYLLKKSDLSADDLSHASKIASTPQHLDLKLIDAQDKAVMFFPRVNRNYRFDEHMQRAMPNATPEQKASWDNFTNLFNGVAVTGNKKEIKELDSLITNYSGPLQITQKSHTTTRKILDPNSLADQALMNSHGKSPIIGLKKEYARNKDGELLDDKGRPVGNDKSKAVLNTSLRNTLEAVNYLINRPQDYTNTTVYEKFYTAVADPERPGKLKEVNAFFVKATDPLVVDGFKVSKAKGELGYKNGNYFYQNSSKIPAENKIQAGDVAYKRVSKNDPFLNESVSRKQVVNQENTPSLNLGAILRNYKDLPLNAKLQPLKATFDKEAEMRRANYGVGARNVANQQVRSKVATI